MKDSVGLQHPAGLRLDNVDGLAAWSSGCPIPQGGRAELVNVAGVRGIEKGVGVFDFDGLSDGGDGEGHGNFLRELRADLDERIVRSESAVLNGQMVSAQRQLLGSVFAGGSGVEGKLEMAGLADEQAVGSQDSAIGIGDREAKFAGAILGAGQRGTQQEQKCGVDQGVDRGGDREKAQIDSPKSAGDASGIVYSGGGRRPLDESATTFGREFKTFTTKGTKAHEGELAKRRRMLCDRCH